MQRKSYWVTPWIIDIQNKSDFKNAYHDNLYVSTGKCPKPAHHAKKNVAYHDAVVLWHHRRLWYCAVVVITTAQLHSTKLELRFWAGSNPVRGVSEIHDGEDLWQRSRLEIRLDVFRRSTIPQKQFIIIIKQFLNNIDRIEKNICGFKAHDKALYTSGSLLNKEEAAEV